MATKYPWDSSAAAHLMSAPVVCFEDVFGTIKQGLAKQGEKLLILALLEESLRDAFRLEKYNRFIRRDALNWFSSEDRVWPYSFLNICDHLDLDAEQMRRKIVKRTDELVALQQTQRRFRV